ncbi:hypothetical protein V8C35DRAFT_301197 [Trichoderma chlorosporum]
MAMKRVLLAAALAEGVAALMTAKPINLKPTSTICRIVCVDGENECGQKYGGCYDPCFEPAPTPPPCTLPYFRTWFPTPVPTLPPTPGEVFNCSSVIICIDGVNSCGIPFGACIPACKPWNIVTPSCPLDDITALPLDPVSLNPATATPIIEPSLVTPITEPLILGSPTPVSPSPVTPTVETPTPETPSLGTPETPVLATPASGTPTPGAPIAQGPVAEAVGVAEGSTPEFPVPWIPEAGGIIWWG